jgi:RNA polymerase sigma-70 factor (ECF subfamily)
MKKDQNNNSNLSVGKKEEISQDVLLIEFEKNRPKLKSYLFRLTAHREDTEDLLQETFIKVSENIFSFQNKSSLKTWIFAIATNLAKDYLRSRNRWLPNAMDLAREESMKHPEIHIAQFMEINRTSPNGRFELREHINFCFTCIGKTLPIEQQVTVLLKEIFDFKINEIAVILEKTEGVIKHLLFNSRKTMEDIFDQRCSLINKNGACHQCSELSGIFNPKQNFQEQKIKIGLENENADKTKEQLFKLRANIAKAINPHECDGSELQFFHFDHINNVLEISAPDKI